MKNILSCAAIAAMLALACNAGVAAAKTTRKSSTGKSTAAKGKASATSKKTSSASARKTAPTKSASSSTRKGSTTTSAARGKKASSVNRTTWRNRQTSPSSDRYREIQGALATRGYLKEEDATGSWNQASTEALKKFQEEQNLDANGKINSLSLIALGLGPRRDAVAAVPKAPPVPTSGQ